MAGTTVNVSIRMDAEIKAAAEAVFSELGLSLGAAVNVFVRQAVRQGGIPFKVELGKNRIKKAVRGEAPGTAVQEEMQKQSADGGAPETYSNLEEFFAKLDVG